MPQDALLIFYKTSKRASSKESAMDNMIYAGIVITAIGLIGLIYCILKAFKARKAELKGAELTAHLKRLVAVNLASFFLSAIGLALVIVGILL
jgi:hypothetical protein